jgi:hypothetical protein
MSEKTGICIEKYFSLLRKRHVVNLFKIDYLTCCSRLLYWEANCGNSAVLNPKNKEEKTMKPEDVNVKIQDTSKKIGEEIGNIITQIKKGDYDPALEKITILAESLRTLQNIVNQTMKSDIPYIVAFVEAAKNKPQVDQTSSVREQLRDIDPNFKVKKIKVEKNILGSLRDKATKWLNQDNNQNN